MQGPKQFDIATLLRNGYVPLASHENDVFFVHHSIEDLEGVLARLGVRMSIYLRYWYKSTSTDEEALRC